MFIYDSHCHIEHLQSNQFNHNLVFSQENMIILARSLNHIHDLFVLRNNNLAYKISFGVHPWDCNLYSVKEVEENLQHNIDMYKPNLIGEIGLDRFADNFTRQIDLFYKQLCIAIENKLPVIIHCVKSYNEIITLTKKVLNKYSLDKIRGVVHAFNSNNLIANELISLGFYLGIGNNVQQNSLIHNSIHKIDINKLLIESDAPFYGVKNKNPDINKCFINAQIIAKLCNINLINLINIINTNLNNFLNTTKEFNHEKI